MARLERQRLEIVTNERIEEPDEAWLAIRTGGNMEPTYTL